MASFFHAVPLFALRGLPLTLQCILPDEHPTMATVMLSYQTAAGEQTLRMLPYDGYTAEESYSVYTATVPAEHMTGAHFSYTVCTGEGETHDYTVALHAQKPLPPFVITEHASEMRWDAHYYELCNPTTECVDLFD